MPITPTDLGLTAGLVAAVVALARVVEHLVLRRSNGNGSNVSNGGNGHAGQMPVSFWREEFRKAVKEGVSQAMIEHNEKVRELFRGEMERWKGRGGR